MKLGQLCQAHEMTNLRKRLQEITNAIQSLGDAKSSEEKYKMDL